MVSRREVIVRGAAVASGVALLRARASYGADEPSAAGETRKNTGEQPAATPGEPG